MSLKMYFDAAGTQPVLTAEKFTGAGPYNLTAFTGAQLGGVYKERKDSYTGITFVGGVGNNFSGLTPDALKGQRVIHNNLYVGQIIGNTDTTIQLAGNYSGDINACSICSYTKLYTPSDFTLAGSQITMITPPGAGEVIHAIPTETLSMYFGGTAGDQVSKTATLYVKRDTSFEYTLLQIASDDTSLFPYHTTTSDVTFTAGNGTGFSGLVANSLVGKAVNHNGAFCGVIISNTTNEVLLDTAYTKEASMAEIYNIGSLTFSTDGTNFSPVLPLADLTGAATSILVHVKDTLNIPVVAINYPSNIIKVSGIEFIA